MSSTLYTVAVLHWLRVSERIEYKIAMLTFRALHGSAPPYLDRSVPVPVAYAVFPADGRFVLQAPIVFRCHLSSDQPSVAVLSQLLAKAKTPLLRFVVDLLYSLLYNKSTTNCSNGVWAQKTWNALPEDVTSS